MTFTVRRILVSLLYLNPPYDFEADEGSTQRTERTFLQHTYRWLKPGGVLVLVIPKAGLLTAVRSSLPNLRNSGFAVSQRPTRFALTKWSSSASAVPDGNGSDCWIARFRRDGSFLQSCRAIPVELQALSPEPDFKYAVPESAPVVLVYKGLPLDEIEDLLPKSSAYRQANRLLFGRQAAIEGRPLTPLHGGHIGLLCTAGMLNGIFGEGENRHIAHWQSIKVVDHFEETSDDGTITQRDRDRFTNRVSLIFADGRTTTLGEKGEER